MTRSPLQEPKPTDYPKDSPCPRCRRMLRWTNIGTHYRAHCCERVYFEETASGREARLVRDAANDAQLFNSESFEREALAEYDMNARDRKFRKRRRA